MGKVVPEIHFFIGLKDSGLDVHTFFSVKVHQTVSSGELYFAQTVNEIILNRNVFNTIVDEFEERK